MKRTLPIMLLCLALLAGVAACDKAPRGIIPESKMEDLLYDLAVAEAMVDLRSREFDSDSSRLLVKQSVFKKHGVDQALYDSSLVWYSHNIETYGDVYRHVVQRLLQEKKNLGSDTGSKAVAAVTDPTRSNAPRQRYQATGDTADLWTAPRTYVLTQATPAGYIKWDMAPDREMAKGDRYSFSFKSMPFQAMYQLMLALEYTDGSRSWIARSVSFAGWFKADIQADTARTVRRIYGYLRYNVNRRTVAVVDSVSLLRTHFDSSQWSTVLGQQFMSPQADAKRPGQALQQPAAPGTAPAATRRPVGQMAPTPAAPASSERNDAPADLYVPKPGVNKGGNKPRQ